MRQTTPKVVVKPTSGMYTAYTESEELLPTGAHCHSASDLHSRTLRMGYTRDEARQKCLQAFAEVAATASEVVS